MHQPAVEAGLLGTKSMRSLFELAEKSDARLILSGDRRQHGSVERGAALRLLETEAGLVPAEIRDIRRQSGEYKRVVRLLSEGRVEEGYKGLARMGWIREVGVGVDDVERYQIMARDYVRTLRELPKGERALVISPTHREAESITDEIRERLRASGELHGHTRKLRILWDAGLTTAERADPVNMQPGDALVFHQNAKGYRKGQRVIVPASGVDPATLHQAERFGVFRAGTLEVAAGDMVRVTRNGKSADGGRPLNNGELHRVRGFTPGGDIETESGKVIGRDYGHLDYGYVVTSHASQGKSVSHVLIGQSSRSFPASSQEQFYVSVSRGKKRVTIYTDDKQGLLLAVSKSDPRLSATELIRERVQSLRRQTPPERSPTRQRDRQEFDRVG